MGLNLYHYTPSECFFKILENLNLKTSSFKNLNDLNEGKLSNFNMNRNFHIFYAAEKYIEERCSVLCFTKDTEYKHNKIVEGTNHPAMWAHYANNANGVCLIIDKEKFITTNKNILENHFYKFEDIDYKLNNAKDDNIQNDFSSIQDFIKTNYKELVFIKNIDWKNEAEHRLFIMDYSGFFSLKGCIKKIVLGNKFVQDNESMHKLIDIISDPKNSCIKQFHPHFFSTIETSPFGYINYSDCASFIIKQLYLNIREKKTRIINYIDYLNWLKNDLFYKI